MCGRDELTASIKERVGYRAGVKDTSSITFRYLHDKEPYKLEDADDFDIFMDRHENDKDVNLYLDLPSYGSDAPAAPSPMAPAPPISYTALAPTSTSSPNVPVLNESTLVTRTPARGKTGSVSIHRVQSATVPGVEEFVEAGGVSGGGRDSILYPPQREPYTPTQMKLRTPVPAPVYEPRPPSVRSKRTTQSQASLQHKVAFDEFHASRGVRLLRGSLGPVNNVPMMLKAGYRHVYVSRSFALDHGFIPVDTTPGTYGYNGITNLGKWPVQVGSKAVPLTVMLAEDSYFPVILGRSFMEKRGVRTDPIDMTSVIFMDNGERADVEVVVVRDELGNPVAIP